MLIAIAACDQNWGIGLEDKMPWHIKEESALFRKNTLNQKVVMGRKTYENLPGTLKNREIYVVTRDETYHPETVTVINDFESFLKEHQYDDEIYFIAGGASIYRQAYPYLFKFYLSVIKGKFEVDTYLDCLDLNDFDCEYKEDYMQFTYYQLVRK